jgi:hypothetical protein
MAQRHDRTIEFVAYQKRAAALDAGRIVLALS